MRLGRIDTPLFLPQLTAIRGKSLLLNGKPLGPHRTGWKLLEVFWGSLLFYLEDLSEVVRLHVDVVANSPIVCKFLSRWTECILMWRRLVQSTLLHEVLELGLLRVHVQNLSLDGLVEHVHHQLMVSVLFALDQELSLVSVCWRLWHRKRLSIS